MPHTPTLNPSKSLMRPIPRNPSTLKIQAPLHILQRAHAVRDDQRGSVLRSALTKRLLDQLITLVIECRGRLIENEDRSVLQKRPRYGYALALAT